MAQSRKIDAAFFDQKWVDELVANGEAHYVLLFLYLIVTCRNPVGIFDENVRLWNFKLNPPTPFKQGDVFVKFGKRIRRIEGHPDKGIMVGFCDFQRSFGMQSKQWAWVVKDLEAVGLTYEQLANFDAEAQPELDLGIPPPVEGQKQAGEVPRRNVIPPKPEWVRDYFIERGSTADEAEKFMNYWTSAKWKRRGGAVADWEATVRTWLDRRRDDAARRTAGTKAPTAQTASVRRKF